MRTRLGVYWSSYGGFAVMLVTLIGSLSTNVYLLSQLTRRPAPPRLVAIKVNSPIPPLQATRLDGTREAISLPSDKDTVIYVLSPNCGWCQRNYANIVALWTGARRKFNFIGLSINGTRDELRKSLTTRPLPFDVMLVDTNGARGVAFLQGTPTTVVVGRTGLIEASWVGAYDARRLPVLRDYFGVPLPGLKDAGADSLPTIGTQERATTIVSR